MGVDEAVGPFGDQFGHFADDGQDLERAAVERDHHRQRVLVGAIGSGVGGHLIRAQSDGRDPGRLIAGPAVFGGDGLHQAGDQHPAPVAVGHDDHALIAVRKADHHGAKAVVGAAVVVTQVSPLPRHRQTQAPAVANLGQHGAGRGLLQHRLAGPGPGVVQADDEARQV
ncbi:hypothetical protein D3C86_1581150 [compost metagenome]